MNATDRTVPILPLVSQSGRANVPGLRRLWLVEARHVLKVRDPRTSPGATDGGWYLPDGGLCLADDAVLHDWRFPADRGGFEEKPLTTVQGNAYGQTLTLTLPVDNPLTALVLSRMAGRKWLAIYTDGNGVVRLVGLPRQPLRFESGLKLRPNERNLTWLGETRDPALYLNTLDAALLSAYQSFQYDFSLL